MTKLEKLMKVYSDNVTKRTELEGEIRNLEDKLQKARDAAEAAAANGNVVEYSDKRKAADEIADILHVKKAVYTKAAAGIPLEEAQDAWRDYAKNADKNFGRLTAAIDAGIRGLADTVRELTSVQHDAFILREKLADMANYKSDVNVNSSDGDFLFKPFQMRTSDPNAYGDLKTFLMRSGALTMDEMIAFNKVIMHHRP